jgi:hypothetical protein
MTQNVCSIINNCNGLTKMNCASRDFSGCFYFKQALGEYCKKIHETCGKCKYVASCTFESKRTRRY